MRKRMSLNKLTVIRVTAGWWHKPTRQTCGLTWLVRTSHKFWNNGIKMGDHERTKSQTLGFTNFKTPPNFSHLKLPFWVSWFAKYLTIL